jgi:GDP-4-dehydro-6-deoxy-D-mannose reductase
VTSSFAKQIALIEAALKNPPVLYCGDLDSERDWTDVRDMVRGYWLALEHGRPGEVYNLGSRVRRSIREMLDLLLTLADCAVEVRQDPARLRPSDVKVLQGDSNKFRALTGWEPRISFKQMMRDSLDWWRGRLQLRLGSF